MPKPKVEMLKSSALFEETKMLPSQAVGFPKDWGVPGAEFEALIDCWFKSQVFFFEGIRFAGCIMPVCWMSRALACWLLIVSIVKILLIINS